MSTGDNGRQDPIDKEYAATLAKGLSVLGSFGHERPSMSLSEIATVTDLSRASARRLLRTLVSLGYVSQRERCSRWHLASSNWVSPISRPSRGSTAPSR
jgi:IclR family pca regulon transcriptional regulator